MIQRNNNFNLQDKLVVDSVFKIGSVFSVKGKDIIIKVNKDKNLRIYFFKAELLKMYLLDSRIM